MTKNAIEEQIIELLNRITSLKTALRNGEAVDRDSISSLEMEYNGLVAAYVTTTAIITFQEGVQKMKATERITVIGVTVVLTYLITKWIGRS